MQANAATRVSEMRATAHPVRLQMLSLLTGTQLSAAEIARELGITHANASYHLRLLAAAGLVVEAGEEKIRGGIAKRYRHPWDAGGGSTVRRPRARRARSTSPPSPPNWFAATGSKSRGRLRSRPTPRCGSRRRSGMRSWRWSPRRRTSCTARRSHLALPAPST